MAAIRRDHFAGGQAMEAANYGAPSAPMSVGKEGYNYGQDASDTTFCMPVPDSGYGAYGAPYGGGNQGFANQGPIMGPDGQMMQPGMMDKRKPLEKARKEDGWICKKCGNFNFGFHQVCNMRICQAPKAQNCAAILSNQAAQEVPTGEWKCEKCNNLNRPHRQFCNMRKCGAPKPTGEGIRQIIDLKNQERKQELLNKKIGAGDTIVGWFCSLCHNFNYENRTQCNMRSCGGVRPYNVPLVQMTPGAIEQRKEKVAARARCNNMIRNGVLAPDAAATVNGLSPLEIAPEVLQGQYTQANAMNLGQQQDRMNSPPQQHQQFQQQSYGGASQQQYQGQQMQYQQNFNQTQQQQFTGNSQQYNPQQHNFNHGNGMGPNGAQQGFGNMSSMQMSVVPPPTIVSSSIAPLPSTQQQNKGGMQSPHASGVDLAERLGSAQLGSSVGSANTAITGGSGMPTNMISSSLNMNSSSLAAPTNGTVRQSGQSANSADGSKMNNNETGKSPIATINLGTSFPQPSDSNSGKQVVQQQLLLLPLQDMRRPGDPGTVDVTKTSTMQLNAAQAAMIQREQVFGGPVGNPLSERSSMNPGAAAWDGAAPQGSMGVPLSPGTQHLVPARGHAGSGNNVSGQYSGVSVGSSLSVGSGQQNFSQQNQGNMTASNQFNSGNMTMVTSTIPFQNMPVPSSLVMPSVLPSTDNSTSGGNQLSQVPSHGSQLSPKPSTSDVTALLQQPTGSTLDSLPAPSTPVGQGTTVPVEVTTGGAVLGSSTPSGSPVKEIVGVEILASDDAVASTSPSE
jgi:hypothetical protein